MWQFICLLMVSLTKNWHCEHLLVIKPLLQIKKVTFGVIVFGNVSIEIAYFAGLLDPNTILGCANDIFSRERTAL